MTITERAERAGMDFSRSYYTGIAPLLPVNTIEKLTHLQTTRARHKVKRFKYKRAKVAA